MNLFDLTSEVAVVIGAVVFLASGKASGVVTGSDICVDGGFLCQTN